MEDPVKYEVRKACNVWLYGNFIELIDTTVHPVDCTCVTCRPKPAKPRAPYDSLHLKQKLSQEI
jgi:hypothetical protein